MRKALSLYGLAHIAQKTQEIFGMDKNIPFNPNGNELQVHAINTMKMLLQDDNFEFVTGLTVAVNKDCDVINGLLQKLGGTIQLENQHRDDVVYGMSQEEIQTPFEGEVDLVCFLHPSIGRQVEGLMMNGTVFSYQNKKTIVIEQDNNIQFIIRPKEYSEVTIEDLIDPRWIDEGTDDAVDTKVVIPKIFGNKAQEIDLSWLAESYTQDNIKFVEVKGEATYAIDENGVNYTQTTAASMCLESYTEHADIPDDAYVLDSDFVITAMYNNSVPLFTFAVNCDDVQFELA